MANERLFSISGLIITVLCPQVLGIAGLEFAFNCSVYTFHMKSKISWEESKNLCEQNGSKLVSMERLRAELNFLENRSEARKVNTIEYYIGLRNNGQKWIWVSDNSTLDETKKDDFPWRSGEPNGNGNCVKMWREKTSPWTYVYDDINCTVSTSNIGYICERTSTALKCGRKAAKPTDKAKSSATELFSVRESSTLLVPTSFRKSITPITYKDITAVLPEGIADESPDITTIVLILLAVIILVVLIVFFLIFSRRRRNKKAKVSSSRKQSSDQTHHLHSSTELTVHFNMSQAREELITIKTVRGDNKECAYAVDENKRKFKCDQEGSSNSKVGEVQPFSKDEHIGADQSALKENMERFNENNDQEEKGRHVYENVLVKGSKAMFCKTTVSEDDSLDVTCIEDSSTVAGDPVERLNHSSLKQGKEINSIEAPSEQDPNSGTERSDHFYAVVDKSKKKRMAPKKPLPYCSGHLMYADMSHLPNNKNGKVHRAYPSTVYADINHSAERKVKTGLKPRLPTM